MFMYSRSKPSPAPNGQAASVPRGHEPLRTPRAAHPGGQEGEVRGLQARPTPPARVVQS